MSQLKLRKLTQKRWQERTEMSETELAKLSGWSPGGAAAQLGISRQAVHKAIHRGDLEAVMVTSDDTGDLVMFMIPDRSVQAFKARRQKRAG